MVDDGSSDGTAEWLASQEGGLRSVLKPNGGPGEARNAGAETARGTYLAFLDSDDLWFPWTFDIYQAVLSSTSYPRFMAGKPLRFTSEDSLASIKRVAPQWRLFDDYLASGKEWLWWGASSFVIRRETFLDVGGFLPNLKNGEDSDLALRLGTADGFVQITAPATFAYREHNGNIAGDLRNNAISLQHLIRFECLGIYPGGENRKRQRREILTRHVRPVALACVKANMRKEAWQFYWSTLVWHIVLRRWRFVSMFPVMALLSLVRGKEGR